MRYKRLTTFKDRHSMTDTAALSPYGPAGYTLIPLHKWDRTSSHKGKERQDGKRPVDADWTRKPYVQKEVLERAAKGFNTGVRLTAEQLVVDVDPRNMPDGRDTFKEFCAAVGLDPDDYPVVRTGSGGWHVYMKKPADVSVVDSLEGYEGVEFKTKGRQVVAAGSKHPNGTLYMWDPLSPELSPARAAPERLLALIRRPAPPKGQSAGGGEYGQDQIAAMLEGLDPEEFQDHGTWLTLMQAVHHASNGDARQEFIEWSTRDPKYADEGWMIGRRWDSLHRKGDSAGGVVTFRTLHKYLRDAGKEGLIPRDEQAAVDDFPDDISLPTDPIDDQTPAHEKKGVMARMNDVYCATDDGGTFRVYYEVEDPSEKRKKWMSMSEASFKAFLMNKWVKKLNKKLEEVSVPAAEEWLRWGKRRTARGVIFDPEKDHPGWLNLWTGWAVEPKKGDWSLMQELIRDVLCDGHAESYEFVMNWMAYLVQKPWEPPEVAICFHGDKGTGKSTLGRALTALAGRHGKHITSSEHITGRFNSHLQDTLMLFADEAVRPLDREAQNRLKAIITERTLAFEAKGKDLRTGMNRIHVMMASNDDWFVPVGLVDGERRYFVARVNNSRQQDVDFFGRLHDQMYGRDGCRKEERNAGLAAMLHDLQLRDLKGWAPRGSVPATKAMAEQKLRNMEPLAQWWFGVLESGDMGIEPSSSDGLWADGARARFFMQDLKSSFEDWCSHARVNPASMNKGIDRYFHAELRKVCPGLSEEKRDIVPEHRLDIRPAGSTGRARCLEFPGLAQCREDFSAVMQGDVQWPE